MDDAQTDPVDHGDLLMLTSDIVSAHISKNKVATADLPQLIESVFAKLSGLGAAPPTIEAEVPRPAVPIRRSVTPDYLVCLEDGRRLKMLKRHLRTSYNLSPEQYRERWNLPADYPMVAPNYAEMRRAHAKKIGLGRARGSGRKRSPKNSVARSNG
ncbi:MucR family transcriptional regulator [Emcibacter sp. SYSU 3D8]|uniref:MucR family transcriptional regulator n=1 Tax=Emcibacter sp. SYSU 3D8 TaxID=3133969 RepID=UPI0031FF1987